MNASRVVSVTEALAANPTSVADFMRHAQANPCKTEWPAAFAQYIAAERDRIAKLAETVPLRAG